MVTRLVYFRKLNRKHRSLVVSVLNPALSTVLIDKSLDEIQSDPCPLTLSSPRPSVEERLFLLIRNTGAVISNTRSRLRHVPRR
jgi:hypothetical protein